jgi:predicted membrane-bound spermidine synthase
MKNKIRVYAFIEGGLVMLLEITSALIAAPVLGASMKIWAILICLSVSALAIGYFIGSKLSIYSKNNEWNRINLLFALGAISISSGLLLSFIFNHSNLFLNHHLNTYFILVFILFFPLIMLGATTPLLTSVYAGSNNNAGKASGNIYATSTMGGIVLALLTGFYLLPNIGVQTTLVVGLISIAILIIANGINSKKYLIPLIVSAGLVLNLLLPFVFSEKKPTTSSIKILEYQEGIMGQLIVADIKYPEDPEITQRILFINRMGQTWINLSTGYSVWSYPNYITSLASMYPQGSRGLVLGLGGGIISKQLSEINQFEVDGVELDERIIGISKKYFGSANPNTKFYNDDSRHFIRKSGKKYDMVIFDLFSGEITPSHSLSLETFEQTKRILNPGGSIVINFNGFIDGKEGLSTRSICKTMLAAGYQLKVFATNETDISTRNILVIGHLQPIDLDKISIHVKTETGEEYRIKDHLLDMSQVDLEDAILITDDKPSLEWINQAAAKRWRAAYYRNFTVKFKEEAKIPIFK